MSSFRASRYARTLASLLSGEGSTANVSDFLSTAVPDLSQFTTRTGETNSGRTQAFSQTLTGTARSTKLLYGEDPLIGHMTDLNNSERYRRYDSTRYLKKDLEMYCGEVSALKLPSTSRRQLVEACYVIHMLGPEEKGEIATWIFGLYGNRMHEGFPFCYLEIRTLSRGRSYEEPEVIYSCRYDVSSNWPHCTYDRRLALRQLLPQMRKQNEIQLKNRSSSDWLTSKRVKKVEDRAEKCIKKELSKGERPTNENDRVELKIKKAPEMRNAD